MKNIRPVAGGGGSGAGLTYVLVYEFGPSNFTIERFDDEAAAKKRAAPFWCVWCIFQVQSTAATGGASISEVATGGVGLAFTRAGIRRHALEALNPLAANVKFANRQDRPIGDASIASTSRVSFGIVFPSGLGIPSSYMFFDKEKPVERIVAAACKHAGLTLEKGRLSGSPERLNLFTLDGDVVRLDLEVEAHLGSTLHPGNILLLEKGNRVHAERLRTVKEVLLLGVGS